MTRPWYLFQSGNPCIHSHGTRCGCYRCPFLTLPLTPEFQTSRIASSAHGQDYVKWRGLLLFRFLATLVDPDASVRNLGLFTLTHPLITKVSFHKKQAAFVKRGFRAMWIGGGEARHDGTHMSRRVPKSGHEAVRDLDFVSVGIRDLFPGEWILEILRCLGRVQLQICGAFVGMDPGRTARMKISVVVVCVGPRERET